MNLDPTTRYRPLQPFGLTLDDMNSSPDQLCVDYAPLNSLCNSGVHLAISDLHHALACLCISSV